MATQNITLQQQYTIDWKSAIHSYDVGINLTYTGNFWDVEANAVGGIAAEVSGTATAIANGNNLETADSYMLDQMLKSYLLSGRKTGFIASGFVTLTGSIPPDGITVSAGSIFSLGSLEYTVTQTTKVSDNTTKIPVDAVKIGAEYNLSAGIIMVSPVGTEHDGLSQGIFGGGGRETDQQVRQRLSLSFTARKTDSMLSDYNQQIYQTYNWVNSNVVFVESVIPAGVNCIVAMTVEDFKTASTSPVLVDISLSADQITSLNKYFFNQRSTNSIVNITTIPTQDVGTLISVTAFTNGVALTSDEIKAVQYWARLCLLNFQGAILNQLALTQIAATSFPFPDFLQNASFDNFTPLTRISPLMDTIFTNIAVTQV